MSVSVERTSEREGEAERETIKAEQTGPSLGIKSVAIVVIVVVVVVMLVVTLQGFHKEPFRGRVVRVDEMEEVEALRKAFVKTWILDRGLTTLEPIPTIRSPGVLDDG